MSKFLADENIASSVVKELRNSGYNVKDIKEEKLFGIGDKEILEIAQKKKKNSYHP